MIEKEIFENQFLKEKGDYLKDLDFINWYRYFYIIKKVIGFKPESILEVGEGSGIVKNCLSPLAKDYKTLDVNNNLKPDFLSDIRNFLEELKEKFQCIIAADVLEHLPFSDFEKSIKNIYDYITPGGIAIITIPHRRSHFLFMTPIQKPHVITIPTGFLSPGAFYRRFITRKIWIDPHHCWEIGDGRVKKTDIEFVFRKIDFTIEKFKKLLYVDFWVLSKNT